MTHPSWLWSNVIRLVSFLWLVFILSALWWRRIRGLSVQFSHSVEPHFLQRHGLDAACQVSLSKLPEFTQTHQVTKVLEFQLHHQWMMMNRLHQLHPSDEYSGLISFRMDWLDLLAVPVTLKSLLQHHSLKASSLQHSAFFMVQLSHTYMTSGKTIALTIWTFVGKVMSLLF